MWVAIGLFLALALGAALVMFLSGVGRAARSSAARIGARRDSATAETEAAETADAETKAKIAEVHNATVDDLLRRARELRERGRSGK